jgi:hypothetical protein
MPRRRCQGAALLKCHCQRQELANQGRSGLPREAEDEQAVKALEFRYAEVLRLMPPYSLEQAEQNYRHLIKSVHPDPNNAEAGTTEKAATLNEAIEYFRRSAAD